MRALNIVALALLPSALSAPFPPSGAEWAGAISKTLSWLAGQGPLPDQLVVGRLAEDTIYDVLKGRDEFSMLVKFIDKDDKTKKLLCDKEKELTLFAPNNDAIHKVIPPKIAMMNDDDWGKQLFIHEMLFYHVLPERITYDHLGQNSTLATELYAKDGSIGGHRRRIRVESSAMPLGQVKINGYSTVTQSDIGAANGIIHKIDTPLFLPVDAMDAIFMQPQEFSTTSSALLKVDLQNHLEFNSRYKGKSSNDRNDRHGRGSPAMTFFAPTNDAWNRLPRELVIILFSPWGERALRKLLQFHTIPGTVIFSEWDRDINDGKKRVNFDGDLSFEWDYHFPSAMSQKLPVHVTKSRSAVPGSRMYNVCVQAHGVKVKRSDMVVQNGALHALDDVLCPRHKQGTDNNQNAKDWQEWKDWFFDWVKEVSENDRD